MGLDMYLYARQYVSRKDWDNKVGEYEYATNPAFQAIVDALDMNDLVDSEWSGMNVQVPVGYWRKANAIHGWIVENCADGVDECQDIYISREKAEELVALCKMTLDVPSMAGSVLPPKQGFFFGSYDIDEYYKWDLEHTIEVFEKVLKSDKVESIIYRASW